VPCAVLIPTAVAVARPSIEHDSSLGVNKNLKGPPPYAQPLSYMADSWDAYDLSEFTATDFMQIDAVALREHNHSSESATGVVVTGGAQGRVDTNGSGGPRIAVALEPAANESVVVKAAEGTSWTKDVTCATQAQNANKTGNSEPTHLRHPHKLDTRSPYETHRLNGTLSVSDLIGPAWYVPNSVCHGWSCITQIKV
jgi:hypothetical protein